MTDKSTDTASTDIVTREGMPLNSVNMGLLRADDAKSMITVASDIATSLADVIDKKKLYSIISGKKYVRCEGWTTLAAMLGVTPQEESNVLLDDKRGYEATIKLVNITTGMVIGRASAICTREEKTWANRDEFTLKSMAATRATGKACRLAFSWIMGMSGYEVTPAEEMTSVQSDGTDGRGTPPARQSTEPTKSNRTPVQPASESAPPPSSGGDGKFAIDPDDVRPISEGQGKRLWAISKQNDVPVDDLKAIVKKHSGQEESRNIPRNRYDAIVAECENYGKEAPASDVPTANEDDLPF